MLLTKKQVAALTSYSSEHIRRLVRDGLFPAPIALNPSPNVGWCRKGWVESEVGAWLAARIADRDAGVTNEREAEISERARARARLSLRT